MAAKKATKPRPKSPSSKPRTKGRAPALPDPTQWFRLIKDFPFPVQVGAYLRDEKTGAVKGLGLYVRIPMPWEEYLLEWPMPPEGEEQ